MTTTITIDASTIQDERYALQVLASMPMLPEQGPSAESIAFSVSYKRPIYSDNPSKGMAHFSIGCKLKRTAE